MMAPAKKVCLPIGLSLALAVTAATLFPAETAHAQVDGAEQTDDRLGIFVIITEVPPRPAIRTTVFHPILFSARLSPAPEVNAVVLTPGFPLGSLFSLGSLLSDGEAAGVTAGALPTGADVVNSVTTAQLPPGARNSEGGAPGLGGTFDGFGAAFTRAGAGVGRAAASAGSRIANTIRGALVPTVSR